MPRHIRLLRWFFLLWLGGVIIYWNTWSWHSTTDSFALHIIVTVLMCIHASIYWIGFSVEMKRAMQWLSLCMQAAFVLVLTHMTQRAMLVLVLSPLLLITATIMLKQVRTIFIFIAGYIVVTALLVQQLGSMRDWSDIWGGGYAPGVAVLGLFFLIVLLIYLQQVQQAHERTLAILHELDQAHAQLSAYALRVEELTMITERQRIARDLHDTLIQGVTGLLMQLGVVRTQLQQQKVERAQELLEQVIESTSDALADARYAIGDLRTGYTRPDDLIEVVQEEISRFTAAMDISCHVDIAALSTTPSSCCEHVLRVISEGLANVARHAHASAAWIQATHREGALIIEVRDNGVGFDPEKIETGHYGLLGMRERARLIGGKLEVVSASGAGTTLCLTLPAHAVTQQEGEEVLCLNPFELSSSTII